MSPELLERFKAIVGADNAVHDPALIASYLTEPRGLFAGKTDLVLRPDSTNQVAAILRLANETGTAIVPQGGNTGLVGGGQPDQSGKQIILSLSRLNKIRKIDLSANQIVAEAGVVLKNLQEAAQEVNRFFPLSLGAEGSCQIGGNLSTNAGGTGVLAYGNARELCLGLEIVLPDGRILDDMRTVKKDNTGYDLKNLFIGAEGTLGVITAAVLKLFPMPRGKSVAYVGLKSPHEALKLFTLAQDKAGASLTGFELIASPAMAATLLFSPQIRPPFAEGAKTHDWFVLLDISSTRNNEEAQSLMEEILSESLEAGFIDDAVLAANRGQERDFWQLREQISPAQKIYGAEIKQDISVPIASIPDFIDEANGDVAKMLPGSRVVCFGHMGDGNLHYDIAQAEGDDPQLFLSHWDEVSHHIHGLAMRYRGSFSAEHGIGQLKRSDLAHFKSPIALDLMRGIKQMLDPHGIMNPGKVLQ